jgi:predicted AlkP superfamily phosphohydrolase/phosphomutase
MGAHERSTSGPGTSCPVVVIGLDACDPDLVELWSREGRLPFLTSLMKSGVWARLLSTYGLFADSPWPSFAAGVSPAKHGFYMSQHIRRGTTDFVTTRASYGRYLPFWWLLRNSGKRAAIFDVPKTPPIEGIDGIQVASWGEYFGLYEESSLPQPLIKELRSKFGRYRHGREIVTPKRASQEVRLERTISGAVERKVRAAEFLMNQDDWDLFVTVFAESHYGGHQFQYRCDSTHWAYASRLPHHALDDALPRIYSQLDSAVAEFCARLPKNATVFIISGHGVETNYSANHLVPAVLEGLGFQTRAVDPEAASGRSGGRDLLSRARGLIPGGLRDALNRHLLPRSVQDRLFSRMFSSGIDWKKSKAFFLPSGDFQGFISINLEGREPWGVIRPGAEYREMCEQIRSEMKRLINPATGRPAIHDVVVTSGVYEGERLYELADLVILWAKEGPINELYHPRLGTIAAARGGLRKSQHTPDGFMIAAGAHIERDAVVTAANVLDLAPTILYLMGNPVPCDLDGRVLLEIIDPTFKAHNQLRFENRSVIVPEEMSL